MTDEERTFLEQDIATVLNRRCRENLSNTPDFILARVMIAALESFEEACNRRAKWYGRYDRPFQGAPHTSISIDPGEPHE